MGRIEATPALAKLVPGVNDLATLYPEVAKEADGWDPSTVTTGSDKKLRWSCQKGHTWSANVKDRTPPKSSGCPFCANKKAFTGFNDLATLYPGLAKQAHGWDPSTVTAGSDKKLRWSCEKGHTYEATVRSRTPPTNSGCPYCSGNRVLAGFNDLATLYPEVAKEADGWDPSTVTRRSNQRRQWRCERGHIWDASVLNRTPPTSTRCPFCAGRKALAGFNDLATLFPDLAKQAEGWDPSIYTTSSNNKFEWRCHKGHVWRARIADRKPPNNNGCPICSGRVVLPGFNDLQTLFPEVAAEAHGWDPSSVTAHSGKKVSWCCASNHVWAATVASRTPPVCGMCPICIGRQVLAGFNDLATTFPEIAKEADGWDPSTITAGSNQKRKWRCEKGHTWIAPPNNRTPPSNSGCPECAEYGFNQGLEAWFYLLIRPGEQQFGITNNKKKRLRHHAQFGWSEVEVVGPFPGDQVLALEKKLKRWLKREVGLVPGTHENWFIASLEVRSLAELKARSGVETDLF